MAVEPGVAWAFVGAGSAIEFVSVMLVRRSLRKLRAGGKATGEVVGSETTIDTSGRGSAKTFFLPVIRFTTQDGRVIVFTSDTGGRVERPKGSIVTVLYNPERPQDATLNEFTALWLFPIITAACGLPFLLAGLFAL